MAAPSKIVNTKGRWKTVDIDPNIFADSKFGDLISFEELAEYDIIDNYTSNSHTATKKKNSWTVSGGAGQVTNGNVTQKTVRTTHGDSKAANDVTKSSVQKQKRSVNKRTKKVKRPLSIDDHVTDGKVEEVNKPTNVDNKPDAGTTKSETSTKLKVTNNKRQNKFQTLKDAKKLKLDDFDDADSKTVCDMSTWEGLMVPPLVLKALAHQGFSSPSPIQALALPPAIRDGQDIMGAAETGSGKTLAFGIPMLHYILKWKDIEAKKTPDAVTGEGSKPCVTPLLGLVLTPTRELAVQVKVHIEAAAQFTDIQVVVLLGGMSAQKQQRILKRCPEIIIATPGRLWELIQMEEPHLSQLDEVKCLVIDEADRMVEKGHFEELTKLMDLMNENKEKARRRHTYVYSATLTMEHTGQSGYKKKNSHNKDTKQLESLMGRVGVKASAKVIDLTNRSVTADTLVEARINCAVHEKDVYLYHFITHHPGRTLVFTNSKDCIRRLVSLFTLLACNPLPLHADMHQKQRLKNLERFTANGSVLLLATDVAARGLDIPDVHHVIHYQVPRTVENYVHRSGRTARVYKEGLSVMLVGPDDTRNYRKIVLQVSKGEDLPLFPMEMMELNQVRPRVNLAQQIDTLEHRTQKVKRENDWFIKAARDMEMELDHDDQVLHRYKPKDEAEVKKRLKAMKSELGRMMKQPLGMSAFLGKYPTHTGRLEDPRVPVDKGDAITQVKNKMSEKRDENISEKRSRRKEKYDGKKRRNKGHYKQ